MKRLTPKSFSLSRLTPNIGRLAPKALSRLAPARLDRSLTPIAFNHPGTPVAFEPAGTNVIIDLVPATPLHRLRGPLLAGAVVMLVFVGGFGVWSAFAPLESAAMASGAVEVESSRKTVQHFEGGIIDQILVKEGDHVIEGQPLVALSDVKARATYAQQEVQLSEAVARAARLRAERDGLDSIAFPADLLERADKNPAIADVIAGQRQIFTAHRNLLDSKIAALRRKIDQSNDEIQGLKAQEASTQTKGGLIHTEIDDMRQLVEKGLERRSRLSQLQRDQAEIEGSRGQIAAQIDRAQQTIAENQVGILSAWYDNANEVGQQLRETEGKVRELDEELRADADVLARNVVRAPEAGVVTDMRVHTPGGVIRPGDALLDLVPGSDHMIITAKVRPEDMDLVRTGLPALVRLLAYKQRRTPPIEGTVTYVSADRLVDDRPEGGQPAGQPYFRVKVALDDAALKSVPGVELVPGMPAEVMIKTGKTTVALYALSPILDSFDRAFREK
jgi:HlyD family secretion protein